jgi:hypothetical protein
VPVFDVNQGFLALDLFVATEGDNDGTAFHQSYTIRAV